jgi:phosphoglycerate kinase
VFISWLERPGGKVVESLRIKPVADRLSRLINREVKYLPELVGPKVRSFIKKMKPGEMVMLENTRFYPGEEADDDSFAKELARNGDLMVMDAFGHAHRVHASVTGIPRHIPAVAGFYTMGEIETFDKLNKSPKHPLTLILGGTKTYDKVKAARHLINKADHILIGGAVANNFLQGAGIEIGKSFLDEAYVDKAKGKKISPVDQAKELLKTHKDKLVMPFDMVAADSLKNPKEVKTIELDKGELIPGDWMFLDIGPRTTDKFVKIIKNSKTIFWDGPMGVYEDTRFRRGTRKVAETVAENDKTTILAGGDTAAVAEDFGLIFRYSHVSIAGGAALQYLAGRPMPGLDVLKSK